jgi:hypothetical protein
MKNNILHYVAVALVMVITTTHASASSYIIGVSPHYTPPDRPTVLKAVLGFVLEGAGAGDKILIYDALNQQPLTQCVIPTGAIFQANARARAQRLKFEIAAFQKFVFAEQPCPDRMTGVINVPEFLSLAGSQLRSPGEPAIIILIGSPFYANPKNPAFNMTDAWPSDGNLLADQQISVFGTANKQKALSGITIHYAFLRNGFTNDYHQERIGRFWSLFVGRQQGMLVTFAADVDLAFQRARDNIQQNCIVAQLEPNDTKVEMRQIMARSIPKWFGPTNSAASSTAAAVSLPFNPLPDKLGIGIMWAQNVDCDLYVQPKPNARGLFFGNPVTSEGRYFHDYRTSNQGIDYEYVELKGPFGNLSDITAWVNLYAGSAPKIEGTVVVCYNGRSYQGAFAVQATSGNQGADSANRASSAYWTKLDLLKVVQSGSIVTSR